MSVFTRMVCVAVAALSSGLTLPAQADLAIAKHPTRNVSCTGGSCVATARNAVMNIVDLQSLLASQSTVSLDAGPAKDLTFRAALTWSSGNSLSLTAQRDIVVEKPITVASKANVTIQSASMVFSRKASLSFWDVTSGLSMNGRAYQLAANIQSLATAIQKAPTGAFALATDYDAASDGTYYQSPIFLLDTGGTFNGLGHTIWHYSNSSEAGGTAALVNTNNGSIANINLRDANLRDAGADSDAILVATNNRGTIDHAVVSGSMLTSGTYNGGLVGTNGGLIENSAAHVSLVGWGYMTGDLVGVNYGTVQTSYADGYMKVNTWADGGLVGFNFSLVKTSYSFVKLAPTYVGSESYGGLVGGQAQGSVAAATVESYTASKEENARRSGAYAAGGVLGCQCNDQVNSTFTDVYWDRDTGIHNVHEGAGNVLDMPGLTGLTDAQLKSALPQGFDPKVWAINPVINNGYPYLLANPPR